MDRGTIDFASQRRNLDLPSKPESGLAEWTSKIKAMQRQVDEDEETETRRLEEEIAASRLARMRRSTGRSTGLDLGMFTLENECHADEMTAFDRS